MNSGTTEQEEALLDLASSGDEVAFARLILPCREKLYLKALSAARDNDDAQDIIQDAVLSAYKNLLKFKRKSRFCTWLYAILINSIRSFFRKKKKTVILEDAEKRIADPRQLIAEKYELNEQSRHLISVINSLEEKYRTPVLLYYYEDLSYEEIADQMNIKEGTVKSRMNKARELIEKKLHESTVQEGML